MSKWQDYVSEGRGLKLYEKKANKIIDDIEKMIQTYFPKMKDYELSVGGTQTKRFIELYVAPHEVDDEGKLKELFSKIRQKYDLSFELDLAKLR